MQFSFDRTQSGAGQEPSAEDNERLRKAIERNRAKMAKRQAPQASQGQRPPQGAHQSASRSPSIADKLRSGGSPQMASNSGARQRSAEASAARREQLRAKLRGASTQQEAPPSIPSEAPARAQSQAQKTTSQSLLDKMKNRRKAPSQGPEAKVSEATPVPTRKSITSAENIEIAAPAKRASTAASSRVSYSTAETLPAKSSASARAKRKVKTKPKQSAGWTGWAVKGAWAFCGFLMLRLVFAEGGVIEYYDKKAVFEQKTYELKMLKNDNELLMVELEKMKSSARFQKKLVRDHLGYIAKDEYLILFSKEGRRSGRGFSSI